MFGIIRGRAQWVWSQFSGFKTGSINPSHYQIIWAKLWYKRWMQLVHFILWKLFSDSQKKKVEVTGKNDSDLQHVLLHRWHQRLASAKPAHFWFSPRLALMGIKWFNWLLLDWIDQILIARVSHGGSHYVKLASNLAALLWGSVPSMEKWWH